MKLTEDEVLYLAKFALTRAYDSGDHVLYKGVIWTRDEIAKEIEKLNET